MQGKIETKVGFVVLLAVAVFIYMGFQVGAFRFDRGKYTEYVMYFKDISGLSRKADVKIAGVKVGWVEKIGLIANGDMTAQATVMVLRDYNLYQNAHAVVRQDGLLGPHFIEVIPGDPLLQRLEPGDALDRPAVAPVSIDDLLQQAKKIATNIEDVTNSFRNVVGGSGGQEQLHEFFANMQTTAERMSAFSQTLERAFSRNEDNIDKLLEIGSNVERLSLQLEKDIFPAFREGMDKISNAFDRDFDRVATRIETSVEAFEQASVQARDGLRNVSSVAEKIDEGKGILGKLVNEDETYYDLKIAVQGFKNYVTKLDRVQFVFDTHFEGFYRHAENYHLENAKGYFDVRIHPNEDHFYLLQLATNEKGYTYRDKTERDYVNARGEIVSPLSLSVDVEKGQQLEIDPKDLLFERKTKYKRNTLKIGLQFGKIYQNIAFRFGLFEGSAGAGVDVDIPFGTDQFRWVTTLELSDMHGWNRCDDNRPYFKWINRMFVLNSIYITAGADDFVSKRNASAFFGLGARFGDDDVKYLLGGVSGAGGFIQS
ncbi:MAG TPA: MlaD family protein [Candidatus Dependentiae bacterium]|nr:MlaD family protein [Candidatus Dependentiae bacterium]HRQ63046.1 MlaD family protein [Candidatus Dependentiae bacterium]